MWALMDVRTIERRTSGLMASTSQLMSEPKFLERLSVAFVGRVGNNSSAIWSSLTATRLKVKASESMNS